MYHYDSARRRQEVHTKKLSYNQRALETFYVDEMFPEPHHLVWYTQLIRGACTIHP